MQALLEEIITPAQRRAVSLFVQEQDEQPAFKQAYAPQSGEVFGILKQMKETFETNLAASQKEEMQNQAAYEDLKAQRAAAQPAWTMLGQEIRSVVQALTLIGQCFLI